MKILGAFFLLAGLAWAELPDAPPTPVNFAHDRIQMSAALAGGLLHLCDLGQTIYHLDQTTWFHGKAYHGRETWLPTQNQGVIAASLLGSAAATTVVQYRFYRGGHPRLAVATQVISGAISAAAIYSSFHSKYTAHGNGFAKP